MYRDRNFVAFRQEKIQEYWRWYETSIVATIAGVPLWEARVDAEQWVMEMWVGRLTGKLTMPHPLSPLDLAPMTPKSTIVRRLAEKIGITVTEMKLNEEMVASDVRGLPGTGE
jgi:hypothetical protein